MKASIQAIYLATAAAGAFCAPSAWAQDTVNDTEPAVESAREIIVTATRRETNLQSTPVAVTALSTQALEDRSVEDLQDVANFTPGLSIIGQAGRGGGMGSNITIRGIGTDSQDAQASVGTYIDDVYFASSLGNVLGLVDVERVEVLRGPQGTLFGRNTIAGAIQYVTTRPGHEYAGYVKGTLGDYRRRGMEAAVTIPVNDTLSVRLAGMFENMDGYVENLTTGKTEGNTKTRIGRARLLWEPVDDFSVDLKAETISTKLDGRNAIIGDINPNAQFPFLASIGLGIPGVPPVDLTGYDDSLVLPYDDPDDYAIVGYNAPDSFEMDYTVYQGKLSWDLSSSLTLKSISALVDSRNESYTDFDQTLFPILSRQGAGEFEVFSQELQLTGLTFNDRLSFVTGLYYFNTKDIGSSSQAVSIGNTPLNGTRAIRKNDSISAFGQGSFEISDRLSLSLGLRYTNETVKSSLENTADSQITFKFTDWSPHIGVDFKASDDIFFYGKASKGFRAGGNTPGTALPNNGISYKPDIAWTYEVGARTTIADIIHFNPTFFYTDWKAIQANVIVFVPQPLVTIQNIGGAEIYGVELEGDVTVTNGLSLNYSAAYTKAKYTDLLPIITDNGGITLDSSLPGVPEFRYTVGVNYSQYLSDNLALRLNGNYAWIDEQRSSLPDSGATTLPSYGLLGARATLEIGDTWSLSVYGTNLTNEAYLIGANDFAKGNTSGNLELDPGRGRAFGVEVKLSF